MGYTASMGTMLMDKLVSHCKKSEARLTEVRTNLGKVEEELTRAQVWSIEAGEEIEALKRQNHQLMVSWTVMWDNIQRMEASINGLILVNLWIAEAINQLRVSQVHNWDNPVVVNDDSSSEDETVAEVPECQGHSHPKLSIVQGVGSKLSADKIQLTTCRYPTSGNTPVWFPGH